MTLAVVFAPTSLTDTSVFRFEIFEPIDEVRSLTGVDIYSPHCWYRTCILLQQHSSVVCFLFFFVSLGLTLINTNPTESTLQYSIQLDAIQKKRYNFMHAPTMALPGVMFTLREVRSPPKTPTVDEIYEFIKTLFNKAQLSSECSLVCLIYVERLMETAHVPLLAGTWKPVLLCGLLLASKVRFGVCMWLFFFFVFVG